MHQTNLVTIAESFSSIMAEQEAGIVGTVNAFVKYSFAECHQVFNAWASFEEVKFTVGREVQKFESAIEVVAIYKFQFMLALLASLIFS